jgi:hypothetical protein
MDENGATLCDSCMPAGGCQEFTVGIMRGTCDHCGREGKSPELHAVRAQVAWPRPISVKERLPELGDTVLFFISDQEWAMGEWKKSISQPTPWFATEDGIAFPVDHVTHWMPLPPSPAS